MVYHRKISTFIRKQNVMAFKAFIKDVIWLKIALKDIIPNSVLIVEANFKPVKSRITKNINAFQIKLIHLQAYQHEPVPVSVKISCLYD